MTGNAFSFDGVLATTYQLSDDEDGGTETIWENVLRIDEAAIIGPYLDASFFGKYSLQDGDIYDGVEDFTDIYSAYLHYSSFQGALELKLGRFSYVDNRFLTLDGAEFTVRTDYYFGATVFGGIPKYFDMDDRRIDQTFRDTGERLYGGKIFLNGVKDTTGFVSYTKEETDGETVQELLGAGLNRTINLGDAVVNAGGKISYDTERNDIYKGVVGLHLQYGRFSMMADGTRYNVQDGTDYQRELVISNFSTGREDRLSYTVQYAIAETIIPYQSTILTSIEVADGEILNGEIYKLGLDINYFKTIGVTSNIEGYYYNSEVSSATGGSLTLRWCMTRSLRAILEGELLSLEDTATDETVYSTYFSVEYDILKDLTVSMYYENNQETRYLPENRYGLKAAYTF